jgi:subtilisin family serine protease
MTTEPSRCQLVASGVLMLALTVSSAAAAPGVIGPAADRALAGPQSRAAVLLCLLPEFAPQRAPNGNWHSGDAAFDALLKAPSVASFEPALHEPPAHPTLAARYGLDRVYRLRLPPTTDPVALVADLRRHSAVEWAAVDGLGMCAATFPDDPMFSQLWGLHNTGQMGGTPDADIAAPEAWDIHTGNGTVVLAVLDTGVEPHPDLQLVPGRNTVDNNYNTHDGNGHGTIVAGIAGALGNNDEGIVGVSWNVPIMPVKCISDGGYATESTLAEAVIWAADHGAGVENLSFTIYTVSPFLEAAVNYAHDLDVVLIGSVGANQTLGVGYPAKFANCLGVGSTDRNDNRATFSVYGPEVDLVAPGVDILSTYPNGWYATYSGTSMSTAYVSGLAVLVRSYNPYLSNVQVEQILLACADDRGAAGWDQYYGWGRINAFTALQLADPHGDLNCDGAVNFGDINPFVLALSNATAYIAAFPGCDILLADINGSGSVGFDDINPFVARLSSN